MQQPPPQQQRPSLTLNVDVPATAAPQALPPLLPPPPGGVMPRQPPSPVTSTPAQLVPPARAVPTTPLMPTVAATPSASATAVATNGGAGTPAAPAQPAPVPVADGAPNLATLSVSLDAIVPSDIPPLVLYDKDQLRIMLHIARNRPHPQVILGVLTYLNTNPERLAEFQFQIAVPKVPM